MSRPRLLFMPIAAAFEAEQFSKLADWADVASFDIPGVGANRGIEPEGVDKVAATAIARLDELGWERCGVVCESHGQAAGIELAISRPDRVTGIFISHAAGRYSVRGERPSLDPGVHDVAKQLLETDYRTFARSITQMTQGLVDDEYIERWLDQVPQATAHHMLSKLVDDETELVVRLRNTELPVVLGKHRGCVMWTDDSFDEAVAAVPDARVVVSDGIPARDPKFVDAVRELMPG